MAVCLRWMHHHMLSVSCAVLWCVQIIEYAMARSMVVFVCLHITLPHYHHYAAVSESIEVLKCYQVHSVECVSKTVNIHALHELCVFSLPISLVMIVTIRVLQIGNMNHLPPFMDRSWDNGMHCMSFYVLIIYANRPFVPYIWGHWYVITSI